MDTPLETPAAPEIPVHSDNLVLPGSTPAPVLLEPKPSFPPTPHDHRTAPKFPFSKVLLVFVLLAVAAFSVFYAGIYMNLNKEVTKETNIGRSFPSPTITPTNVLHTYTNTTYHFTLDYPFTDNQTSDIGGPENTVNIITLADKTTSVMGTDAPFNGFNLSIYPNKENISLQEYVKEEIKQYAVGPGIGANPTEQSITIGSQSAIVLTGNPKNNHTLYFVQIPNSNSILIVSELEKSVGSFQKDFTTVLSTFQFTKPLSMSPTSTLPQDQSCTQDIKVCPDGSGVSRTGLNCTFAACPTH